MGSEMCIRDRCGSAAIPPVICMRGATSLEKNNANGTSTIKGRGPMSSNAGLTDFMAKHCVQCTAVWNRRTVQDGRESRTVMCLVDNEPVSPFLVECSKFKSIHDLD